MGFEQGSIGETSVLACLIGAVILIVSGVGSWRIILSIFVGGYLMGLLMNIMAPTDNLAHAMHTPAHFHWLLGSFAFGAVFMATDPVSAAQTNIGKIIYGLLIGIMIVILRVFNPAYPESRNVNHFVIECFRTNN